MIVYHVGWMKLSATSCNFGPTLLQLYYNFDPTFANILVSSSSIIFGNYVEFLNNYPIEILSFVSKKESLF
jgi:hypothetical protein